jgi:hypothetical protein
MGPPEVIHGWYQPVVVIKLIRESRTKRKRSKRRFERCVFDHVRRAIVCQHETQGSSIRPIAALFPILKRVDVDTQDLGELPLRQVVACADLGDGGRLFRAAAQRMDVMSREIGGKAWDVSAFRNFRKQRFGGRRGG